MQLLKKKVSVTYSYSKSVIMIFWTRFAGHWKTGGVGPKVPSETISSIQSLSHLCTDWAISWFHQSHQHYYYFLKLYAITYMLWLFFSQSPYLYCDSDTHCTLHTLHLITSVIYMAMKRLLCIQYSIDCSCIDMCDFKATCKQVIIQNFRFSHWNWWRYISCRMWYHFSYWIVTDILKDLAASETTVTVSQATQLCVWEETNLEVIFFHLLPYIM